MEATILRPGDGEVLGLGAGSIEIKATAEATGGAFSIAETTLAPGFPGPVPHLHHQMVDSFYVLEGTLTVQVGDEEVEAGPGTFACVPPGVVHTFRNATAAPVRMLNINAPGGWERYLRELVAATPASGPPDPEAMAALAVHHDFEPAVHR